VQHRLHLRRVVESGALGEGRHDRAVRIQQRERADARIGLVTGRQEAREIDLLAQGPRARRLGDSGEDERRDQHRGAQDRSETVQQRSEASPGHAGIQLHAGRWATGQRRAAT
jgi:hypothetical protein